MFICLQQTDASSVSQISRPRFKGKGKRVRKNSFKIFLKLTSFSFNFYRNLTMAPTLNRKMMYDNSVKLCFIMYNLNFVKIN